MKNDIKHILAFCVLLLAQCSIFNGEWSMVWAQTAGMNSSYSRFGLGLLHDQSQGFNKSMAGAGLGIRNGNIINMMNPASFSAIDSLSLILDVGMTASFGKMEQGTKRVAVNNASFDYAHIGMHIARNLGLAAGFVPYTSIGYEFTQGDKQEDGEIRNLVTTQKNENAVGYSGSGGLNQAYIGVGWRAYRNLSVGANASFVWGNYSHTVIPVYTEGGVISDAYYITAKYYDASLKTFKIDFGVQYPVRLTKQDWLNLGLTYGLGHKISQDVTVLVGDSTNTIPSPFDLPHTIGFGATWQHKNTLMVAADVHNEFWSACRTPIETANGYEVRKGSYKNLTKIVLGAQWTPDPFDKRYWKRIRYRLGASYTTPYLKVNGMNGPSELKLSIGAGLPITNRTNNRSVVNFGVQWLRRSASGAGMIKENYLLLNLGLTFNERWFLKYKIE